MPIDPSAQIASTARVHPDAVIGPGVTIGEFAIVEQDVAIGAGSRLEPYVYVKRWTTMGERNAIFFGLACESVALIAATIASQGWVIFAVMPLFALGGVGNPALQSLMTQQADADSQGRLQGVIASVVSLASIFGPLFFAGIYFAIQQSWPGLIWLVGVGLYVLAIPLVFGLRRPPEAPQPA